MWHRCNDGTTFFHQKLTNVVLSTTSCQERLVIGRSKFVMSWQFSNLLFNSAVLFAFNQLTLKIFFILLGRGLNPDRWIFAVPAFHLITNMLQFIGAHSTVDSILASLPAAPSLILGIPEFFQRKKLMLLRFIGNALLREWTVQNLKVDQTHLVLISG